MSIFFREIKSRMNQQVLLGSIHILGLALGYVLWVKYYLNLTEASSIKKLQPLFLEIYLS